MDNRVLSNLSTFHYSFIIISQILPFLTPIKCHPPLFFSSRSLSSVLPAHTACSCSFPPFHLRRIPVVSSTHKYPDIWDLSRCALRHRFLPDGGKAMCPVRLFLPGNVRSGLPVILSHPGSSPAPSSRKGVALIP